MEAGKIWFREVIQRDYDFRKAGTKDSCVLVWWIDLGWLPDAQVAALFPPPSAG